MGRGRGRLGGVQGEQQAAEALAPGSCRSREDFPEPRFCEVYHFSDPVVFVLHVAVTLQHALLVGVLV